MIAAERDEGGPAGAGSPEEARRGGRAVGTRRAGKAREEEGGREVIRVEAIRVRSCVLQYAMKRGA